MITARNIQKNYGILPVLADVSFSLARGQKVALVGNNGTGKTTLLKILAGLEDFDGGSLDVDPDLCVGYLPQDTSSANDESIAAYLKRTTGIGALENEMETLSTQLNEPEQSHRYAEAHERYVHLNGYAFEHRIQIMLTGFGLENITPDHTISHLSSGQKTKVALAGILLKGVDLLLLDEPTNNLDLPALIWLEDFLKKSDAACIMVSHDRRFLDRVVRKIFEIDRNTHTLMITGGTYSDYLEAVAKKIIRQKESYRLQQEEIGRLTEKAREKRSDAAKGAHWTGTDNDKFLKGFKRNRAGKSSRAAKVMEKRIDRMDRIDKPVERNPFEIPLKAKVESGPLSISISNVIVGYPGGFMIGPLSFDIPYGNRTGIIGLNGSGKSTLLKTITGHLSPISGSVAVSSGIKMGNMMQEHETLPRRKTPLEFLVERAGITLQEAYAQLGKFDFAEEQAKLPIDILSPGGRARLLLALFSAESVNTLILDEPTNHLDLEALEALEETLRTYQGTVLLVTHDRYFLDKAHLDTTYVLSEGILTKIPDYKDYMKTAEDRARKLLKSL